MDLKQFRSVLGWSAVINLALLLFFGIFILAGDQFVYKMWSLFFEIPYDAYNIIMIAFLGFWKLLVIVFFVIPYFAIGKVLKK